jgi:hypothetical protein
MTAAPTESAAAVSSRRGAGSACASSGSACDTRRPCQLLDARQTRPFPLQPRGNRASHRTRRRRGHASARPPRRRTQTGPTGRASHPSGIDRRVLIPLAVVRHMVPPARKPVGKPCRGSGRPLGHGLLPRFPRPQRKSLATFPRNARVSCGDKAALLALLHRSSWCCTSSLQLRSSPTFVNA